jgi:predicted RNA-binding protein with PUA-like domain
MAYWLCKSEPNCYAYSDLEADGETLWDGVSNPLAQKHLRSVQPGDLMFFYHTGDEKAIVGVMAVSGPPQPDPRLPEEKTVVVPVKPVRRLPAPVTLAAIKADPMFSDWELVRQARLSVMPVSPERWRRIEAMATGSLPHDAASHPRSLGKRK